MYLIIFLNFSILSKIVLWEISMMLNTSYTENNEMLFKIGINLLQDPR